MPWQPGENTILECKTSVTYKAIKKSIVLPVFNNFFKIYFFNEQMTSNNEILENDPDNNYKCFSN